MSVIILVTTNRTPASQMSDLLITRKNTDRIGFHSVLLPLLIINITIFANVIGELTALLFHYLFCRVVIGQCDRTVGCNRTPVIGQMKQPINSLPFPTKMCKLIEIGEKDFFSSATLVFFLSWPLFSTATSLFIHAQFFSPSATFSKPAPYPQSANFYCVLWWTARWPFKKDYSVVFFLAAILIFVLFSIELSLCFTRLSSSIAFGDRFVRRARNLKALKKKSRVEKSRSQKAWCRGSWFPFQTTVEWIEVFMQTAPYNILSIAQTTWSHQPRFLCSILIRIRNFQRPNFHVGRFGRYIIATFSIVLFSYYDALHFMRLS